MDQAQINGWLALFAAAQTVGQQVLGLVRAHAQQTLSPAEYAALIAKWDEDVQRAAANAGIDPSSTTEA